MLGVALTGVALVLDQALVGLLRGDAQFCRNVIFAVAKLAALGIAGYWLSDTRGIAIYATWAMGNLVSLVGPAGFAALRGSRPQDYRPKWGMLRGMGRPAFEHYALNLALQAPFLAIPVAVTATLSAATNAYFYTAWMMAGFVYVGPYALTTALYAVGARAPALLAHKLRFTLGLSLLGGTLASLAILLLGGLVLGIFGSAYAAQAELCLTILVFGVFPLTIKHHYIAIHRIYGRTAAATPLVAIGGALELGLSAIGAGFGGLAGLGAGFLLAACIEGVAMLPAVVQTAAIRPEQANPDADASLEQIGFEAEVAA
jgi:O-antigen/teichoic acid export membrane protein